MFKHIHSDLQSHWSRHCRPHCLLLVSVPLKSAQSPIHRFSSITFTGWHWECSGHYLENTYSDWSQLHQSLQSPITGFGSNPFIDTGIDTICSDWSQVHQSLNSPITGRCSNPFTVIGADTVKNTICAMSQSVPRKSGQSSITYLYTVFGSTTVTQLLLRLEQTL